MAAKSKFFSFIQAFLLCIFLASCCQHDPFGYRYTTEQPQEKDIAGIYEFDFQTVNNGLEDSTDIRIRKAGVSEINIKSNGTFEAKNIPYFKKTPEYNFRYNGVISTEGSWSLAVTGCISGAAEKCEDTWGIRFAGMPDDLNTAGLMENKPPYGLIFGFGDPDAGRVIIFKRKNKPGQGS